MKHTIEQITQICKLAEFMINHFPYSENETTQELYLLEARECNPSVLEIDSSCILNQYEYVNNLRTITIPTEVQEEMLDQCDKVAKYLLSRGFSIDDESIEIVILILGYSANDLDYNMIYLMYEYAE